MSPPRMSESRRSLALPHVAHIIRLGALKDYSIRGGRLTIRNGPDRSANMVEIECRLA